MSDHLTTYLRALEQQINVEFFYVGGAVRDGLLGIKSDDIDLVATGLEQSELMERLKGFGNVEKTGAVFGVIRFFPYERKIPMLEISLPRKELSTGFGHKDFTVEFDHTLPIEEDLLRRDFTINAIALRVSDGELIDPAHGVNDISSKLVRVLHKDSAKDDPLRILRGIRFMAKLGFDPAPDTHKLFQEALPLIRHVSAERLQYELLKTVTQPHFAKAFRYAQEIGVIAEILPELEKCVGCTQNKWHTHDVWEHTLRVVEHTPSDDAYVKLAALFHDVGKPFSKWIDSSGEAHFYYHEDHPESAAHEEVGADIAKSIMRRLKFSKFHTDRVAFLVRQHMFARGNQKAARRFLARLSRSPGGVEANVEALFALREGDTLGGKPMAGEEGNDKNREFHSLVLDELSKKSTFKITDLALNGLDLIDIGIEQGPEVGKTLKWLLNEVIVDPELNTRETLTGLVQSR